MVGLDKRNGGSSGSNTSISFLIVNTDKTPFDEDRLCKYFANMFYRYGSGAPNKFYAVPASGYFYVNDPEVASRVIYISNVTSVFANAVYSIGFYGENNNSHQNTELVITTDRDEGTGVWSNRLFKDMSVSDQVWVAADPKYKYFN